MKPIHIAIVATLSMFVHTDGKRHPAEAVAEVERAFARTSRETNTVNAFLKYLAEDAIMFRAGEPVDGMTLWKTRTADSTLLDWWPVLADISESGDLGYTTGPYQFFNKRTDSAPVANGYYSTIWQKQQNGEWKIKVDLGVRLESIRQLPQELTFVQTARLVAACNDAIEDVDNELNKILNQQSVSFDERTLATDYRIHRVLIGPSVNSFSVVTVAEAGVKFIFESVGGEAAVSKDFAYSYGKVLRTENDGEHRANYLRVWRVEAGGWKIVLDVVTEG